LRNRGQRLRLHRNRRRSDDDREISNHQAITKARHPNFAGIVRIEENAFRLTERIIRHQSKGRRGRVNIARMPQAIRLRGQKSIVRIARAEGDRSDAIQRVDFSPMRTAICRAIEPTEAVRRAAPTTEDAHIPSVLRRVGRINNDVLGPIEHARIRDVGPRLHAGIVDEHA